MGPAPGGLCRDGERRLPPAATPKATPYAALEEAAKLPDVKVFHAGTSLWDGVPVSHGGRVLGVTAPRRYDFAG